MNLDHFLTKYKKEKESMAKTEISLQRIAVKHHILIGFKEKQTTLSNHLLKQRSN